MVRILSSIPFFRLSNKVVELPVFSHQISTKDSYRLNCLKLNGNGLLAAGNEAGSIVIFNLLSTVDGPQQVRLLGFDAGGVSDLFWINNETLAVGTTRGWLVVYSMRNEAARFSEVCNVKAHGDGVSHISVENIDFCPTTQTLVSVGEGVGSIKLWNFTPQDGRLTPHPVPLDNTAYQLPRFVSFTGNGSKLMVGYLQNALVQTFSLQPWTLTEEHILGEDNDVNQRSHLNHHSSGSAFLLEASGILAIFNLTHGLDLYEASTFVRKYSAHHPVHQECNQGLAVLRGGTFLASAARDGAIYVFQTRDANLALKLKVPGKNCLLKLQRLRLKWVTGRGHQIDAIHASKCGSREFLVASSYVEGKPSVLTVWCHNESNEMGRKHKVDSDHSTFRLVILCVTISIASHFIASISPLVQQEILSRIFHDRAAHSSLGMSKPGSDLTRETLAMASDKNFQMSSPTPVRERYARHQREKSETTVDVITL
ncbi:hypothetical protein GALMADRAFT_1356060 [Galerina marginata CBS 339.88]|uniref:Anaphase-promoting complex subunit 4 WD40 domain-containing protein n=1 Tax=Galerina marginata (strain CBS 339.88) TaxID=685588 RepID=A0A067SL58_GALM3|nr:hypothetical protein GALMADRAFT_1356060 [Galerina marginata CBS 339.88]